MRISELTVYELEIAKDLYKNYLDRFEKLKFDNIVRPDIEEFTFEEFVKYDIKRCDICNEIEDSFYLVDDEGFVNGGIGLRCPNCRNDGD